MKILFVGSMAKLEDCNKYLGSSVAGSKMQVGLLSAIKDYYKSDLTVYSQFPIATFPREKQIFIEKKNYNLNTKISAINIPFINVFIVKHLSKFLNTFRMIKSWASNWKSENKIIISYNSFPYIGLPVLLGAKLIGAKSVCILADLPINVDKKSILGKFGRWVENSLNKKSIKKFDALIVLNENAIAEYAPKSKYIIVDGGFDLKDLPSTECGGQWNTLKENELIKVIYSGALVEYNGLINLVEAAKLVENQRFVLEIYGSGELVEYVKSSSAVDSRIKYMGRISNDKMIKVQQEAALLINPRPVNDPVSKVTFPSKIIEYLLSGTPVVTTKLNGLTDEYLDQVYVFEDETPQCMAKTIDKILTINKKDLIKKATRARQFVIKEKNWVVQGEKIIKFINSV